MSAFSENNAQNATNCAFSLRQGRREKFAREKKNCQHTLVHHAVILYELSVHRALSRYSELYY